VNPGLFLLAIFQRFCNKKRAEFETNGYIWLPMDMSNMRYGKKIPKEFLRQKEVMQWLNIGSSSTIYRWIRNRDFPSPIRIGQATLYHLPSISQWLCDQEEKEEKKN